MEDQAENQTQNPISQETTSVSFPSVGQPKKSSGARTLLVVGILILIGILGFVIYKSATSQKQTAVTEPTPYENLAGNTTSNATIPPQATPIASPSATVDKSKIQIQVQNGTGIAGEAAYLQKQLEALGYTNVKATNAPTTNATDTTVTFSSSLDSGIVAEITQKLNTIYQSVITQTSASTTYDVVIVTGLRKGATPLPTVTATITPSPKPTATP
jgi:hypothetical protein